MRRTMNWIALLGFVLAGCNGGGSFQAPLLIYDELGGGGATRFAIPTRICPWYSY